MTRFRKKVRTGGFPATGGGKKRKKKHAEQCTKDSA